LSFDLLVQNERHDISTPSLHRGRLIPFFPQSVPFSIPLGIPDVLPYIAKVEVDRSEKERQNGQDNETANHDRYDIWDAQSHFADGPILKVVNKFGTGYKTPLYSTVFSWNGLSGHMGGEHIS
jgi:hypothetical protein